MIAFLVGVIGINLFLFSPKKTGERALRATDDHCNLANKLYAMLEDPAITEAEWRSWLPIARFADERWLALHPYVDREQYGSLEQFILRILGEDECARVRDRACGSP